jgi:hypothetical protein
MLRAREPAVALRPKGGDDRAELTDFPGSADHTLVKRVRVASWMCNEYRENRR